MCGISGSKPGGGKSKRGPCHRCNSMEHSEQGYFEEVRKNSAALIKQSAKNVCKRGILLIVVVLHARDLVARTVNQRKRK